MQANTVADQMFDSLSIPKLATGAFTLAVVAAVILGGIKRIGRVTAFLAPIMAAIYVFGALLIIVFNFGALPAAVATIFIEAFNPQAGVAGVGVGVFLITVMWGVRRGLFSNEAGQGSAPIAHAAAKTEEPVAEGVVALLGPFIDTIVICSFTGIVIVMTGVYTERFPTELTLGGGDITYTTMTAQNRSEGVIRPAEIAIINGRHADSDAGAPLISWHETSVEPLYTNEA